MSKSSFGKKHMTCRAFSRIQFCLLLPILCMLLCSCQNFGNTERKGYTVELVNRAGNGYFWSCKLSEDGIVRVETEQNVPEKVSYGTEYPVTFTFTGEHYGDVEAELICAREYDDSVRIIRTCKLTVDRNNDVTGELTDQKVIIDPGEPGFSLSCTDSSVISWIDLEDGTFEIKPLREGSVTITLTKEESSDSPEKKIIYNMTVSDDMQLGIKEQKNDTGSGQFESMEELCMSTGFEMNLPEEAEVLEIRSVDGMGYVRFKYLDREFSYVAGYFDMDSFFGAEGKTVVVNGFSVGFPYPDKSLAGWKQKGVGYYLMADEKITDSAMLTLIRGMIR